MRTNDAVSGRTAAVIQWEPVESWADEATGYSVQAWHATRPDLEP